MVKPPPAYPVPAMRPVPPAVIAEKVVADLRARRTETTVRRIDERPPRYAEWPEGLDARLIEALRKRGLERPYTHQAAAIGHARAGQNCVVVTPTASGKTLCYNVPVLDAMTVSWLAPAGSDAMLTWALAGKPLPSTTMYVMGDTGCAPEIVRVGDGAAPARVK